LSMYGGILDKYNQLTEDIADITASCDTSKEDINSAKGTEGTKLSAAQGDLAEATKSGVESEQEEQQSTTFDEFLKKEYAHQMKECCDNRNGYMSQLCGLKKIRAHLYQASGQTAKITDCEVSEWTDEPCSASCEGGTQKRSRAIIAPPVNGTQCPPLEMERECNIHKCPIDCQVGVWSEWTACSAGCGGGVRTRLRHVTVEPKYDGQVCPEESETQQCNPEDCNRNCELGDWGEWSGCSKLCHVGHRARRVPVLVEQKGQGTCPHPDSEERLGFEECNKDTCMSKLSSNRSYLECHSKVDVVLIIDGSGSVTQQGFDQSMEMGRRLLMNMVGGGDGVEVGVWVFGGPKTEEALDECSGHMTTTPDWWTDCGMRWVTHLTRSTERAAMSTKIWPSRYGYPGSTSLVSMALADAKTELEQGGRTDAGSVVVIVTDAQPMSPRMTAKAAEDLKTSARLIWVPIGPTDPGTDEVLKTWASKPWQDNIVKVGDINLLPTPDTVNAITASVCPEAM